MPSNIVSSTIDETYPVAGIDNDSQGFRDNFQIIKDNFAAAKSEVEDLQDNAARKDEDNNFSGNKLLEAELDQATEAFTAIGTVNTDQNMSFLNGHYQSFLITDVLTLTLADWPVSGKYAKMTAQLELADGVTFNPGEPPFVVFRGEGNAIFKSDGSGNWATDQVSLVSTIVDSNVNPVIIEFWTTDGGDTIYARHLGKFGEFN